MPPDQALGALMSERRILLRGDGNISRAVQRRLLTLEVPVVHEKASATDAIIAWEPPPRTPGDLGLQVQWLTNLLDMGSLRRVVLLLASEALVATGVAETFTLYAAAHLVQKTTRFNMLRLPASPSAAELQHASSTALMLVSGLMDAVHGQVLSIVQHSPEART